MVGDFTLLLYYSRAGQIRFAQKNQEACIKRMPPSLLREL